MFCGQSHTHTHTHTHARTHARTSRQANTVRLDLTVLFTVSNVSDVMPRHAVSKISNTNNRFNTSNRSRTAKADARHILWHNNLQSVSESDRLRIKTADSYLNFVQRGALFLSQRFALYKHFIIIITDGHRWCGMERVLSFLPATNES